MLKNWEASFCSVDDFIIFDKNSFFTTPKLFHFPILFSLPLSTTFCLLPLNLYSPHSFPCFSCPFFNFLIYPIFFLSFFHLILSFLLLLPSFSQMLLYFLFVFFYYILHSFYINFYIFYRIFLFFYLYTCKKRSFAT